MLKKAAAVILSGVLAMTLAGCSTQAEPTPEELAASNSAMLLEEEASTGIKRLTSQNLEEYEKPVLDFVSSIKAKDPQAMANVLGAPNTFGDNLPSWIIVNDYEIYDASDLESIRIKTAKSGSSATITVTVGDTEAAESGSREFTSVYTEGKWILTPPSGVVTDIHLWRRQKIFS